MKMGLASCVALNAISSTKDTEPKKIVFTSGNHDPLFGARDPYLEECAKTCATRGKIEISRAETEFLKKMMPSKPKNIYGGCFANRRKPEEEGYSILTPSSRFYLC